MISPTHPKSFLRIFLATEAAGGIILMIVAALALIVANSPLSDAYFGALHVYVGKLSLELWEWQSGSILEVSTKVAPDDGQSTYVELRDLAKKNGLPGRAVLRAGQ